MTTTERTRKVKLITAAILLIYEYYKKFFCKTSRMNSSFTRDRWIEELINGHPERLHSIFRMSQDVFIDLLHHLETSHDLHRSARTTSREVLGLTLYILSHNESIRATCERFQHSTETVSKYFSIGLDSLVSLASEVIKPLDPTFSNTPSEILHDRRYMPYFKDCIGAIDGTHVDARVSSDKKVAYISRCGALTQNVMTVCDFNICFTFIVADWEGTAHDSRIFNFATKRKELNFLMPPEGKYYLVDAGYPMQRGFLKPYPETKYHILDFQRSNNVARGKHEIFNKRHSSLRGVIERDFGVWKKKWVILRDMSSYKFDKQVKIVVVTMTLHNYIRRHHNNHDIDFAELDADQLFVHPEAHEYHIGANN